MPSTSLTNLINGLISTIGTPTLATVSLDINSREPANDPKLLNLDATISSRATQASVTAIPTNPLLTTDGRLNNLDASISSVNTALASVNTIVSEIQEIEKGRWKIVGNQMIFYKTDNVTEIFRCNLFGQTGNPTMTNVFERVKV